MNRLSIAQGYYKRNRHFQCCIETKLLMIWPKYLHGFVIHVFTNVLCVSLKQRITTAVAIVDEDMLRSAWTELDYRIDICRVTKGSHIEHL
jgi:hypothetical protein